MDDGKQPPTSGRPTRNPPAMTGPASALLVAGPERLARSLAPLVTALDEAGVLAPVARVGAALASLGALLALLAGLAGRALFRSRHYRNPPQHST